MFRIKTNDERLHKFIGKKNAHRCKRQLFCAHAYGLILILRGYLFVLLVVVQGQCTMGCAADESGMEDGFSEP
jgi:hypothetical protein